MEPPGRGQRGEQRGRRRRRSEGSWQRGGNPKEIKVLMEHLQPTSENICGNNGT